ncbi:MAG: helix-turn-helix domain-containing protein [Rhodopseudomonas sp.]|nr:helix-turn-helix domain-containing protein [Rhodopseudomonas sp.]
MVKTSKIWPSPRLIRAARGLIGISQAALAEKAGVTQKTITKIEADDSEEMDPRRLKVLRDLQRVLEDVYGVEFFAASEHSGEGVRFRKK